MDQEQNSKSFDLFTYAKKKDRQYATSDTAYNTTAWGDTWRSVSLKLKDYTPQEISNIIDSGSLEQQQKLSRNYFYKDGYYKQIICYYATLLKYQGVLIPNPSTGKSLSTPHIQKKYYAAIDFVEAMNLPAWLTSCAQRALVDGCYYGVRADTAKNEFLVIDLPAGYCQSRFKDPQGNDLIEFNLSYFDTIADQDQRAAALKAYPSVFNKEYKKWKNGSRKGKWFIVPSDIGICFPIFDGRPFFLSVIPAALDYDDAITVDRERDLEGVHKIIVQKIPHTTDGRLVFEPDEAEEIHHGSRQMLKGEKNTRVLTTYADVDAISTDPSNVDASKKLDLIERNIFTQAGVSSQIFASTGASSLGVSLQNDLAFMMYLANKMSFYLSNLINSIFANSNVTFKYSILPISYYNSSDFIEDSVKLVGYGYSFLLPSLALGINQKDLIGLKGLENDLLMLNEKLVPLSTSYTQSSNSNDSKDDDKDDQNDGSETEPIQIPQQDPNGDQGGRPALKDGKKSDKTVKNIDEKK